MKKIAKLLLFLLGAPLMLALVVLSNMVLLQNNWTYGIYAWSGVAVAGLVFIVLTIIVIVTGKKCKKTNRRQVVRRCTGAMVLSSVILTAGVWGAIDIFVPGILADVTQGTIKSTDLIENYEDKSEEHAGYLTSFIEMNVANGNLTQYSEEEYQKMGYSCPEVVALVAQQCKSQDKVGYNVIKNNGPWLNMADGGRMTIGAVVHLVINERNYMLENDDGELYDVREEFKCKIGGEDYAVQWTIMDMTNPVNIDLSGIMGSISGFLPTVDAAFSKFGGLTGVTDTLTDVLYGAIGQEEVAGSGIYVRVDLDGEEDEDGSTFIGISIQNVTEDRGVFDYKHTAWFQSNHLLVAVVNLYGIRHVMYFCAGFMAIFAVLLGFVRESEYKANYIDVDDDNNGSDDNEPEEQVAPKYVDPKSSVSYPQTPYMEKIAEAQAKWANQNTIIYK